MLGVVVAGDALHFRELADHLAGQVALGQDAGARGAAGVTADTLGDKGGEFRHALGLVEHAAELGLEHHVGQALVALFQRLALVLLEEELGVGEARAHHLLVAGDDLRRVLALDVGHGDKARQQLAVAVDQAEVLLVVLHGGDQRFLRDLKEAFLEGADQRHRPLDQGSHLIQQRRRHDGAAVLGFGQFLDALGDLLAALGEVGDHEGAAQVVGIAGRALDRHLVVGVEAVATGHAPGLLGEDLAVDHMLAVQHDQPLGRTDEFFLARGPAHALGDRQLIQGGFDDARQQADGALPGDALAELQLRAALVDLAQLDAALLGEAEGGLGRVAVLVEGGLHGRPVEVDGAVRLLAGQGLDQHGQAARRGVVTGALVAQAGGLEAFLDARQEGLAEALQGLGWQLFGAQFDQEIMCTHACASSLARTSSRSSGVAIGKPSLARASR